MGANESDNRAKAIADALLSVESIGYRQGYAQALRDFDEAFGGYMATGNYPTVRDMLHEFAAERGIDLEGK